MLLGVGEGLEYMVCIDRMQLAHASEFKYLGYILDESGTDETDCCRKVAGAIRSLFNGRGLQLKCDRVLHKSLLMSVLMYGSKTMIWKEKERSSIKVVQLNNLIGFLGSGEWIKSRMNG